MSVSHQRHIPFNLKLSMLFKSYFMPISILLIFGGFCAVITTSYTEMSSQQGALPYYFFLLISFALIGLGLLIYHWIRMFRAFRILKKGAMSIGFYKNSYKVFDIPQSRRRSRPVLKVICGFQADNEKAYEASAYVLNRVRPEVQENPIILYDAIHPNKALIIATLPGPVKIDQGGNFVAPSNVDILLNLGIPFLALLLGIGLFLWFVSGGAFA